MGYTTIIFGGVTLNVTSCINFKSKKKQKQVMGDALSQINIIGKSSQQNELSLTGKVYGTTQTNLDANRTAIQALDVASAFAYTDGLHNGTYYVVRGSLQWSDVAQETAGVSYTYNIKLVEE